ncbi:MAG: STT3 domain-containing protein [Burkholderiaceae bacterium]
MGAAHSQAPAPRERFVRAAAWIGLALALACTVASAWVRLAQLDTWREHPEVYFPGGVPTMTTLDAYYGLRWAQAWRDGTFRPGEDDPLRLHQTLQRPREASEYWPGLGDLEWRARREPLRLPGTSWVLATFAPLAGGLERAGILVFPVLGCLFVVPMFLYGRRIGHPAAALMGALVANFSLVYYERTSPGWVDTDALNLFFPWVASLLVLGVQREQRRATTLALCVALGVTLHLYFRWYEQPALAWLYWGTLAVHLVLQRVRIGFAAACVLACVIASHPLQAALGVRSVATLVERYVLESNPTARHSLAAQWFPDVMRTVGELRHTDPLGAFAAILSSPWAAAIGTLAFVVVLVTRWRVFVPLLPMLALAVLALARGPRFAMYLAPFAGFGLGLLVEWAVSGFFGSARLDSRAGGRLLPGLDARGGLIACAAVVVVFVAGLRPLSGIAFVGQPAVRAPVVTALGELSRTLPPDAALWSWWDDGYAIEYLAKRGAYHDGGGQYTPQTALVAYSLVSEDPAALRGTIDFVDRHGNAGIDRVAREAGSRVALLARVAQAPRDDAGASSRRPVVLFFTAGMTSYFGALRYAAGLPTTDARGEPLGYQPLACTGALGATLSCKGFDVDLSTGRFTDGRSVDALVVIEDGRVARKTTFAPASGAVLQVIVGAGGRSEVLRVPAEVYRSNFNRMFLLGEFDAKLYEETYRPGPAVRVFKLLR